MLPNRFCLTKKTEEKLKREKSRTGISPNILARQLFFESIEAGHVIQEKEPLDGGNMMLEKSLWLAELETPTELILKNIYGELSKQSAANVWALHVQLGSESLSRIERA